MTTLIRIPQIATGACAVAAAFNGDYPAAYIFLAVCITLSTIAVLFPFGDKP